VRRRETLAQLGLTDQQRDRIAEIRDRHQREAIEQRARLRLARLDLHKLLRADRPDRGAIDRQIDELARLRAELGKARIGSMLEVRSVLTPAQQRRLKSLRGARVPREGRQI
jgi:Spy/CpxP family protein refolding chaperone